MIVGQTTEEGALVAEAAAGNHEAFRKLVEPLGRELHLFCYRMLGSFHDAEDVVQEARLKAWRGLARYDGRAGFRTWMYRIVTHAALDALRSRRRRVLPQDLGAPRDAVLGLGDDRHDIDWIEPYPDSLLPASDPHAAAELRESVRLAFVRVLQVLPPRQRAVLILRDVLDWPAAEVATALESSVAAVNSALQRARATIGGRDSASHPASVHAALDERTAALADRYVSAWEAGDINAVVSMLTTDAIHAMPPWSAWFVGRETLRALYASYPIWNGRPGPGVFRVVPTSLNGGLGFAEYCRSAPDRPYEALALTIVVPDPSGTSVVEKVSFLRPDLFEPMGFAPVL